MTVGNILLGYREGRLDWKRIQLNRKSVSGVPPRFIDFVDLIVPPLSAKTSQPNFDRSYRVYPITFDSILSRLDPSKKELLCNISFFSLFYSMTHNQMDR